MIADSLLNLKEKRLIFAPEDDPHISSELRRQGAGLEEKKNKGKRKKKGGSHSSSDEVERQGGDCWEEAGAEIDDGSEPRRQELGKQEGESMGEQPRLQRQTPELGEDMEGQGETD